ncbi:MAG TPA: hypothetical protein VGH28_06075 [Polyangiaceae bacterium]|jgi:hypothetical protein
MSAILEAIEAYVRAWNERDPAARAKLIEQCWAVDGRLVTRSRTIRGRDALDREMAGLQADPQWKVIRLGKCDAVGTTFRFEGAAERHDGTSAYAFDAGEIDADGRIVLILTFPDRFGSDA